MRGLPPLTRHLRRNLVAYLALLVALSGTSYAAATTLVPANSVGSPQIINHSIKKVDLGTALPRGQRGRQGPQGLEGAQGPTGPQGPPGLASASRIELTSAQVNPVGVVRAFIRTDSSSPKCLVTLNESANAAQTGTTAYCGERHYLGVDGVLVSIFLPAAPPNNVLFDLTVYQESALMYGQPVYYPGT